MLACDFNFIQGLKNARFKEVRMLLDSMLLSLQVLMRRFDSTRIAANHSTSTVPAAESSIQAIQSGQELSRQLVTRIAAAKVGFVE